MPSRVALVQITDSTPPVTVGELHGGETLIGREPGQGISIHHTALSRQHGVLLGTRSHWLYRDLGSTNGSWINGLPCPPQLWRFLRVGDVLQCADLAFRVESLQEAGLPSPMSLSVFEDGVFVDEYLVPDVGPALHLGGVKGDLPLRDWSGEEVGATFERSDGIMRLRVQSQVSALVNGVEVNGELRLTDRDSITIGSYQVLFCDEPRDTLPGLASAPDLPRAIGNELSSAGVRRSGLPPPAVGVQTFRRSGERPGEDVRSTVALGAETISKALASYELHPGARQGLSAESDPLSATEKRLIGLIVLLLVLSVGTLLSWWLFL